MFTTTSTASPTRGVRLTIAGLAAISGVLMALYLLVRPYGDSSGGDTLAAAHAFASPLWVVAHVAGAASLVALAALWAMAAPGLVRWASLIGVALVLPYYGAETFGLHEIGSRVAEGNSEMIPLVAAIRDNPTAITMFGAGLILLAVAGIAAAAQWYRVNSTSQSGSGRYSLIPLATVATLFLPQYFVPPAGRIAYGLMFAAVAAYTAYAMLRTVPNRTS